MNNKKIKHLAVICGGTGGHFYPGLTIARAFQENKNCKACLFIGGHKVSNQTLDAAKYNIEVKEVKSARISKQPIKFIKFIFKFAYGYIQGKHMLKKFKPDAVLAMGSFTSVPISLAAVSLGLPLFLHDGNAMVGRANIFLSKWAKLIMTAFPANNSDKLKCRYICAGMPLRPEILTAKLDKPNAIDDFNREFGCSFTSKNPTLLIFGGSQGAATINRVVPKAIYALNNNKIQIIHLIGKENIDTVKNIYNDSCLNYAVLSRSDNMSLLYSIADFVICRSGGSTVAELIYFKKPAILIPYPLASDLHQNHNANFFVKLGLGEIVNNSECTKEVMLNIIDKFLEKYSKNNNTSLLPKESSSNATEEVIRLIKTSI